MWTNERKNWSHQPHHTDALKEQDQCRGHRTFELKLFDWNCITYESLFPCYLWFAVPSTPKRTNIGPESLHTHYSKQLYHSHSSINTLLNTIVILQSVTCIKSKSLNMNAPQNRPTIRNRIFWTYSWYCQQDILSDSFQKHII